MEKRIAALMQRPARSPTALGFYLWTRNSDREGAVSAAPGGFEASCVVQVFTFVEADSDRIDSEIAPDRTADDKLLTELDARLRAAIVQ